LAGGTEFIRVASIARILTGASGATEGSTESTAEARHASTETSTGSRIQHHFLWLKI
jgi:hypothetical protein